MLKKKTNCHRALEIRKHKENNISEYLGTVENCAGGRDKVKAKKLIVTELSETVNTNKTMSQSISELSVIVLGRAGGTHL